MKLLITTMITLMSLNSFGAGGYEKPALFSPEANSLGGAVSSSIDGSSAVIFNPAGIDKDEIELNISVTNGDLYAPIFQDDQEEKTNNDTIYPLGIMFSKKMSERVSLGFGVYGLAGLGIRYDKQSLRPLGAEFGDYGLDPYAELGVLEYNTSFSYKLTNNLSFGASLRGQSAQGAFSKGSVAYSQGLGGAGVPDDTVLAGSNVELYDLEGSEIGSYNLGLQYESKNWGMGLVYRSRVEFDLKGKSRGNIAYSNSGAAIVNAQSGGAVTPVPGQEYALNGGNTNVAAEIPEQVKLGGHYNFSKKHTLMLEYALTKYSNNKELGISNTQLTNSQTGEVIQVDSINQRWSDLKDYRMGYQYNYSDTLSFRLGYVISSAVTNEDSASPLASPPSEIHHQSIGFGKLIPLSNNRYLEFNAAFEHYEGEGRGSSERVQLSDNTYEQSVSGNYKAKVNSLMFGLTYGY